jgi:hypothetical protein
MLAIVSRGWFSRSYDLYREDREEGFVGDISDTKATILGCSYRLLAMSGFFMMKSNDEEVARAEIKSHFPRLSFDVHIGETDYIWQAEGFFSDRFQFLLEGVEVGTMENNGGRAMIRLPETLSLPIHAFLFWLKARSGAPEPV